MHNDSDETAADVVVKVRVMCDTTAHTVIHVQTELQTTTQRIALVGDDASQPRAMVPGAALDDTVCHEMKELGIHMCVLWPVSITLMLVVDVRTWYGPSVKPGMPRGMDGMHVMAHEHNSTPAWCARCTTRLCTATANFSASFSSSKC